VVEVLQIVVELRNVVMIVTRLETVVEVLQIVVELRNVVMEIVT
jgi:hypothetical protein